MENNRKCKYYHPLMDTLKTLCQKFYKLPDCECGGPLHILLDDDNFEDTHIKFCLEQCDKCPNKEVAELGKIICNAYLNMSMKERSVFDWFWNGNRLNCNLTEGCNPECRLIYDEFNDIPY